MKYIINYILLNLDKRKTKDTFSTQFSKGPCCSFVLPIRIQPKRSFVTWVITLLLIICPSLYKARPDHFIGPPRSWFHIVCPQYEPVQTQLLDQIFLWAGLSWSGSQATCRHLFYNMQVCYPSRSEV